MRPLSLRKKGAVQLTYDIPQQIRSTQVYPVRSPNGSSIIVLGLDTGLRILWRGGRPFKVPKSTESRKHTINGDSRSDIMVIDSDEEDASTAAVKPGHALAEFEAQNEEIDPDEPYENIIRTLDIPMSSVRQISVPHVPGNIQQVAPGAYPPLLYDHIVVTTVSSDFSIAIVSLPLNPPAPTLNDLKQAQVQMIKLAGPHSHQDLPTSVSMTYTYDDRETRGQSRSRSRSRHNQDESTAGKDWAFLIASTSPMCGGILLVHEVPLVDGNLHLESSIPSQRQYLRSGVGCKVLFNPSMCPAARHSNLLIIFPSGLVKVYQCIPDRESRRPRSRRSSSGTTESMTSKTGGSATDGRFLITLHTAFVQGSTASQVRRISILDAAWVLGGTAVLALLEDGSWGVWDIEGTVLQASSGTRSNLLQGSNASPAVLNGQQLVQLSVKGRISETEEGKQPDLEVKGKPTKFAPMTPHTRKVRSEGLFRSKPRSSPGPASTDTACLTGGISVSPQISRTNTSEESVLIFYNKQNVLIPNLLSYFKADLKDRDSMDISSILRPISINALTLPPNTPQTSVCQLPLSEHGRSNTKFTLAFSATQSVPDILATTGHHLVFFCKPIEEPELEIDNTVDEDEEDVSNPDDFPPEEDQQLLTQGELDIDGMTRILDGMKNGTGTPTKSKYNGSSLGPGKRRTGIGR